ncbi:MAG: histidine kinase, partial [Leeuwenhoekiella sp.]
IYRIVDNQQTVITERMKEISIKNDKLLEISKMNAHHVREPLSRIMGIVEIIDHLSTEELHNEALGYLRDSAKDLDCTLKQIIDMSSTEIDKFGIK